ncbi:MAG TPA: TraR/DksA C4-type zinc finger protein [Acidimicrobiales bacterium]|nr:TraR/DksA C4-type zinc finger protein [Acidimicrobiales bacterium]
MNVVLPSGVVMDHTRAASLLRAERLRVQDLLSQSSGASLDDRAGANEQGDMSDPATSLTQEEQEDAVNASLRERLAAIERAEERLRDGSYGKSVRSGELITDERLEADPAAELTVEEAQAT